jgi:hypothetical protein
MTKGMGPEVLKLITLPPVKYVAKVPPIAEITEGVVGLLGTNVRVKGGVAVKESFPVAEKKPVMESARAKATLLKARAVSTRRRFIIIVGSPVYEISASRAGNSPRVA